MSRKEKNETEHTDIYAGITQRIVADLEKLVAALMSLAFCKIDSRIGRRKLIDTPFSVLCRAIFRTFFGTPTGHIELRE